MENMDITRLGLKVTKTSDLTERIEETSKLLKEQSSEDAFYIVDLGEIVNNYATWMRCLPRVRPFYAVKCCSDPLVSWALTHLGAGFDCASQAEIETVLGVGARPNDVIYAHTIKAESHLRYATDKGIKKMTFDNHYELNKIKDICPDADLFIRIKPTKTTKVSVDLSTKFGCPDDDVRHLLETARDLGLKVMGISFHVGCRCTEPSAYTGSILKAYEVAKIAKGVGFNITVLDLGGGFQVSKMSSISFQEVAGCISEALDEYFPPSSGITVIAEPGTYMVTTALTLVPSIIGKRQQVNGTSQPAYHYYINDGIYCSFRCWKSPITPFKIDKDAQCFDSVVWGNTGDSTDVVFQDSSLPELDIGDRVVFNDMGAYTTSVASGFNGMPKPKRYYFIDEQSWCELNIGGNDVMENGPICLK